jgi:hypothetical protein
LPRTSTAARHGGRSEADPRRGRADRNQDLCGPDRLSRPLD